MQNILNLITKCSIYVLAFLLPLFWLPFTFEALEYNKQYLLFFLVSLSFFSWLAKMVFIDKEIRFKKSPLDLFILVFLAIAILSVIFSVDKNSSIFGFYGRFSDGLIGLLSMGVLYFLITNNSHFIKGLLKLFTWSGFLAIVTSYLSLFGIFAKLASFLSLPAFLVQRTFNPIAGSLEGLSVFLAIFLVFLVGRTLFGKAQQILNYVFILAVLFLLLIIDFTPAWMIILITLVLFVGFSLWKRLFKENANRLSVPIFLIIIAAVLASNIPFQPAKTIFGEQSIIANLPKEQVINQKTSWVVGFESATDNLKSGFFGSGIGTFHYDFAKQKPETINQTWLWQIRFDRAGSFVAESLGTIGFLGLLSYLAILGLLSAMIYFFYSGIKSVAEADGHQLLVSVILIALIVSQFFFYQNTTTGFLFWLILGIMAAGSQRAGSEIKISFRDFPEMSLVFSTSMIVVGVIILSFYFFASKFYLADINYTKGLSLLGEERVKSMENAVRLNPSSPKYLSALARTYLYEAIVEGIKPQKDQNTSKIQTNISGAIDMAQRATNIQPNSVANWETRGLVYREISGVASGAVDWGIKSFNAALGLEPTNPVLYTELGKLYLMADNAEKAKESFNKAIGQKSDYADGLIQLALLLERQSILDEAIKNLETAVATNPLNIDARFQLGRLYFNAKRTDEAISQFKQVIILAPDHSNAHYSLGVAYAAQNENDLAIQELEKVLELNPGTQDVIQKINDLKAPSVKK